MASVVRKCPGCGARFRVPGQSRRVRCETCSPPRLRTLPAAAPVEVLEDAAPERWQGRVESAVLAELARVDRQGCVAGVLALELAHQLDRGVKEGSQAASLAKQIQSLVRAATADAKPAKDWVDDLVSRREARATGT